MADINIERKGPSLWLILVLVLAVALALWFGLGALRRQPDASRTASLLPGLASSFSVGKFCPEYRG